MNDGDALDAAILANPDEDISSPRDALTRVIGFAAQPEVAVLIDDWLDVTFGLSVGTRGRQSGR